MPERDRPITVYNIHGAQEIDRYHVAAMPTTIHIHKPVPPSQSNESSRAVMTNEGRQLAHALIEALPGCTLDTMLAELLEHRRSSLVIVHPKFER